jgi:lipopolysaccharide/colanic/teichoic acid biosynthesis glycosyltransferase
VYRSWGKRVLDLVLVILFAPLWLPLIIVVAAVVGVSLGWPIFFRQLRPGLHGRPFTMTKLRTMREAMSADGTPLADELRLTRVGRLLRSLSLDELLTLWYVLRGEMSLVGPRPLLMEYLPRYSPEQSRRHEVRPGITGWAQVNGRNAISWDDKLRFDVWYVDNLSFSLDLQILAMTIGQVLRRSGVSAAGHATMPEFMGSGQEKEDAR